MSERDLRRFRTRVRLVRGWWGLAIGATLGAGAAALWMALDWLRLVYAEWPVLALMVAAGALLGAIAGLLRKVPAAALADSIDRRARLEERLTTATERAGADGTFDEALRDDAQRHLAGLRPAKLYPIRFGRWHLGALALSIIAASLFLLGNTPIFLDSDGKQARKELQERKDTIERVIKPLEEMEKRGELSEDEKRLAHELRKLMKDLQRARLNREEALQKGNELSKEAQKLAQDRFQKVERNLAQAESAYSQMQQEKLRELGLQGAKPELMKLSESQLQQMIAQAQQQVSQLEKQLENESLTAEERSKLQSQLEAAKQKLQELKLSERAKKMLERMGNHPLMKEIAELARKLQQANQDAMSGSPNALTPEQLEELRKAIEELAKQLESEEAMREYLEALRDALKNAKIGGT